MQEIWKDIKFIDTDGGEYDYSGMYQVSNMGRVRSVKSGKIRKLSQGKTGYLSIGLHKNKQEKKFYIHRLVAHMFIENPNNFLEVNHKDENKTNNHVSNLEWCTREYNMNYGTRTERASKECSHSHKGQAVGMKGKRNIRARKVICVETNMVFDTIVEASEYYNINKKSISGCCVHRRKRAGAFHWMYYDEYLKLNENSDSKTEDVA